MKSLIIVHSHHHGNTRKIAHAIAEVLSSDVKDAKTVDPEIISSYDVIGFGSGIYAGRHHVSIFDVVNKMKEEEKKVFVFSTRAIQFEVFYHKLLIRYLKNKKCAILKEFSCQGFSTYGPLALIGGINKNHPDQTDIENAKIFAREIIGLCTAE